MLPQASTISFLTTKQFARLCYWHPLAGEYVSGVGECVWDTWDPLLGRRDCPIEKEGDSGVCESSSDCRGASCFWGVFCIWEHNCTHCFIAAEWRIKFIFWPLNYCFCAYQRELDISLAKLLLIVLNYAPKLISRKGFSKDISGDQKREGGKKRKRKEVKTLPLYSRYSRCKWV